MRKLDLIIENIRDEYMINLLEEGEVTELQTLKTKKFLNENLNRIRGMLVEEGAMDAVKQHLGNNWGKYLGAAGAATGAGLAANELMDMGEDARVGGSGDGTPMENLGAGAGIAFDAAKAGLQPVGDKLVDAAGNIYDQAGNLIAQAGEAVNGAIDQAGGAIDQAMGNEQPVTPKISGVNIDPTSDFNTFGR